MVAGGHDAGCVDDHALQLEHISAQQAEFDAYVSYLESLGVSPDKAVDLARNDPAGVKLEAARQCMDAFPPDPNLCSHVSEMPAAEQIWLTIAGLVVSGLIALYVANYTIKKSFVKNTEMILTTSRDTLFKSLEATASTLEKTRGGIYYIAVRGEPTKIKLHYVNQKFSTVPLESIINSGSFALLPASLQTMIDTLYFEISTHNEKLSVLDNITMRSSIEGPSRRAEVAVLTLMIELTVMEGRLKKIVDQFMHDLSE